MRDMGLVPRIYVALVDLNYQGYMIWCPVIMVSMAPHPSHSHINELFCARWLTWIITFDLIEWSEKVPEKNFRYSPSYGSRVIFKLYWDVAPLACPPRFWPDHLPNTFIVCLRTIGTRNLPARLIVDPGVHLARRWESKTSVVRGPQRHGRCHLLSPRPTPSTTQ